MNDKPELAWTMYISSDHSMIAFKILSFIAHEFYRMGFYYFAFKSFLHLEKFSPSIENGNAKIASATGVFFKLASGKDNDYEKLQDVINGLADSVSSTYQSEEVLKMIKTFMKWGKEKGYNFTDNIY